VTHPRIPDLALAIALLIPGAGGLWKAASMQGDLNDKWHDRVALAFNGLSEKAVDELIKIQTIAADRLGGPGTAFDPSQVVRDPSELSSRMDRFRRLLRVRDRVRPRFRHLLWVGPWLVGSFLLYVITVVSLGAYTGKLTTRHYVEVLGVVCGTITVVALVGAVVHIR
jgi:hypothetical protein